MIPERLLDGPGRTSQTSAVELCTLQDSAKFPLKFRGAADQLLQDAQLWSSGGIQYVPYPIYVFLSNGDRAPESKFSGKT
jgi:hypothetical protein